MGYYVKRLDSDAQGGQTTSDDTNTTMYDFIIQNDAQHTTTDDFGTDFDWGYGDHNSENAAEASEAVNRTIEALDDEVDDDLLNVLEDAANITEDVEASTFECQDCGLNHSHADWKHDIRNPTDTSDLRTSIPGFNVDERFATRGMEYNPKCHCGVNELAMLMPYYGYIGVCVFRDQSDMASVAAANPATVEAAVRDVIGGHTPREVATSLSNETIAAGEEALLFLNRVQDIQDAANNAPIPSDTRQEIKQTGDRLRELLSE